MLRVIGDFLYSFLTSTVLGMASGLLTAFVLCFGRHSSIRKIALTVLMAYLSYMLAELFELSGILSVFLCRILMSHCAWHNLTDGSRITTRPVFAMMSFIAEIFIFLDVGKDALDIEKWKMSKLNLGTSLGICSTLILTNISRACCVSFPLSALSNYMKRAHSERGSKITFKHMMTIWWAGLMRGAVSIALAFEQFTAYSVTSDPINATMITTTIIVVLFSTVVFGLLTKPLIKCLLPHPTTTNDIVQERLYDKKEDMTLPLLSLEESVTTNILRAKASLSMLMERPTYTIHYYWRKFDNA